jgi:hypothetical protein
LHNFASWRGLLVTVRWLAAAAVLTCSLLWQPKNL